MVLHSDCGICEDEALAPRSDARFDGIAGWQGVGWARAAVLPGEQGGSGGRAKARATGGQGRAEQLPWVHLGTCL